jgi:hypothetical protein
VCHFCLARKAEVPVKAGSGDWFGLAVDETG